MESLDALEPLTRAGFDCVVPSLPGYGRTDKPWEAGWGVERIARAWAGLMAQLGYDRYGTAGSDWGTSVSASIAQWTSTPPTCAPLRTKGCSTSGAEPGSTWAPGSTSADFTTSCSATAPFRWRSCARCSRGNSASTGAGRDRRRRQRHSDPVSRNVCRRCPCPLGCRPLAHADRQSLHLSFQALGAFAGDGGVLFLAVAPHRRCSNFMTWSARSCATAGVAGRRHRLAAAGGRRIRPSIQPTIVYLSLRVRN